MFFNYLDCLNLSFGRLVMAAKFSLTIIQRDKDNYTSFNIF